MICKNCGRPITVKICDYCGTDYRTDEEKKNDNKCDHIYDAILYEPDIRRCYGYLVFKCERCGEVTKLGITKNLEAI